MEIIIHIVFIYYTRLINSHSSYIQLVQWTTIRRVVGLIQALRLTEITGEIGMNSVNQIVLKTDDICMRYYNIIQLLIVCRQIIIK